MKKILLSLTLLISSITFCQTGDTLTNEELVIKKGDSLRDYYQRQQDSLNNAMRLSDTARIRQEVRNSADYWVRLQNENRAKQKKAAITRIAIGVAGFAILIIGLMRRRKKK